MRLLYQSAGGGALVLADDRDEYYIVQLVGEVGKKNYQTALREVIKQVEDDGYTSLLMNMKDLQSQPDLAGYWFWAHFVPRFHKKAGACKIAILRAKESTWRNQLSKATALLRVGKVKLDVRFFDALPTAQDWLIDGFLPEKEPAEKRAWFKLPTLFKKKKQDDFEEEEEEEDYEEEENKKPSLLKRVLSVFSFLKKVKVKVKFDPKGRLDEDD